MKRIIVLWDTGDRGKTNTLIELGNLLLSESTTKLVYCNELINVNEKLPRDKDFTLVLELSNKIIGIVSQGDPNSKLKERLTRIIDNYNVDYFFCASRTRGETSYDVYKVSHEKDYDILLTSTYYTEKKNEMDFLNFIKARHLLDLLRELINQEK